MSTPSSQPIARRLPGQVGRQRIGAGDLVLGVGAAAAYPFARDPTQPVPGTYVAGAADPLNAQPGTP